MFRECREGKGTATNAEDEKCCINTTDVENRQGKKTKMLQKLSQNTPHNRSVFEVMEQLQMWQADSKQLIANIYLQ